MRQLKIFLVVIAVFMGVFSPTSTIYAQETQIDVAGSSDQAGTVEPKQPTTHPINIYMFWGEGCPHCAKAKPFLENLAAQSDDINYYNYEIYYSSKNQGYLKDVVRELDIDASGVPLIVVGNEAFVGFSSANSGDIEDKANQCLTDGCPDNVASIVGVAAPEGSVTTGQNQGATSDVFIITLPVFGDINAKDFSLPLLTIIIAALDGFNPCAMWVLIFLISLLLGMKNRRRMWVLGSSFIVTSAAVYFLFMTAWLNIFLFIGLVTWVKILIGLVALGAGSYYLYDYYTNKSGTCKVTGNERRKKIFEKLREITHEQRFWVALIGIILLALAVNLVEMVCSAGLPAVYTSILASSNLSTWQYYAYILLYILIFMADDMFVFLAAMATLKMVGVHQKYARYAHLIGGFVMIILGILLVFAPELLMFG